MGSSYYGETNLGNERSGSSRKGKKSNSDKPRQPQRGLGVAQLEKIRLHSEMGCSYLPNSFLGPYPSTNLNQQEDMRLQTAYSSAPSSSSLAYTSSSSSYAFQGHQNAMMGFGELERGSIKYFDSQPNTIARWNPGNEMMLETRHFVQQHLDSTQKKRKKDRSGSMGSTSQNSETSDTRELDLELRLAR
ncbi:protein SPEAR3-like [Diospyros lotus]|uniref:protein SPEAR3-like n=1 Tax=Diospyros lotus TaxID=55363 RepID=UPI00224CB5B7|nr:protein SPEAR3-like [Diospyros lotus]XP_052183008.1 protein SPEAR3-like [Diospyros lotus]XP_052183009.1 protein SPEAR3-like [Diospyros lotus]XP_052183010.1 protein SPEAR3-like [Diospyros lotus]